MPRGQNYDGVLNMIEQFEYKFKKQITVRVLEDYIAAAYKISLKTAREYITDLQVMKYIVVGQDSKITRVVK